MFTVLSVLSALTLFVPSAQAALPIGIGIGGGGGGGDEPVERLFTCWECSVTIEQRCEVPTGYHSYTPEVITAYGMSGEACEAALVAPVLDYLDDEFTYLAPQCDLYAINGASERLVTPAMLSAYYVQSWLDNDYVGDTDNMPAGLVCDDSPWYRELKAVKLPRTF